MISPLGRKRVDDGAKKNRVPFLNRNAVQAAVTGEPARGLNMGLVMNLINKFSPFKPLSNLRIELAQSGV